MKNIAINIVTKLMVVFMGLFVSSSVLAQNGNVMEETARQVGLNFLRLKDGNPRSDMQLTRVDAVQYPNLYVYNTSENGFIVVASDNRMEPILAYSDEGTFDKDNVAPGANFWFEMYEYAIESIVRNNVREVDEEISRKWENLENGILPNRSRDLNYPQSCQPLIQTQWGQGDTINWSDNYNRFCPWYEKDGRKYRAYTGCVATALGQLLNYLHRVPAVQTMHYAFTHDLEATEATNLKLIGLYYDTITSINYDCNELNNIRHYYYWGDWNINNEEERAAQISFDCGLAVDMMYGFKHGSGAFNQKGVCPNRSSTEAALQTYFGYPEAYGLYKNEYTDEQWRDTLKKYLSHDLPLVYEGRSVSTNKRHAFICDGYDAYDGFHFNFGNYGNTDGYYTLNWTTIMHWVLEYNIVQYCLIAYPINDVINIHDEIGFYESLTRNWYDNTIIVEYDENPSINENSVTHTYTIKYNSPGYYRLNPIVGNDKVLNYSVQVLPINLDTIYYSETICRRAGFFGVFGHGDNVVTVSLSRDETDFEGSQTFYRSIRNSVTGTLTGILILTLTTEGAVSEHTLPPVTVHRCDLTDDDNCYHWNIGDESYCCNHTGRYEKVFNRESECDSVVYLDLTIIEPESTVLEDTLLCFNSFCQPFNYHGKEITTAGIYYVCENDVFYTLDVGLIDTIRKPVDIDICTDEAPYTWHGHTLPWSTPGFYDTIFRGTLWECQCDTVYYIYLNIRDCCEPPLDCVEDELEDGNRSNSSNLEAIYYGLKHYFDYRGAMYGFLANVLREALWSSIEERNTFWNLFQSLLDTNSGMMSEEAMQQLITTNPYDCITEEYIEDLVERYNRSVMYWNEGLYAIEDLPEGYNTDFIEYDTASMNKAYEAYDYAIAHGFSDVKAMYDNA